MDPTATDPTSPEISFAGHVFTVPAMSWAVRPDERLAVATFGNGPCRHVGAAVIRSVDLAAGDFSLVRTSRAPLLVEHTYAIEALLGQVVDARLEEGRLKALVRFARSPEADRLYEMLRAGFPLSLSLGSTIETAVKEGDGYRATRWRLREISVCVWGKDEEAELCVIDSDRTLADWLRHKPAPAAAERQAIQQQLCTNLWHAWAFQQAAPRLAERFGLDKAEFAFELAEAVAAHAAALEARHLA